MLRHAALRRLADLGFDMKQFIECIEEVCTEWPTEKISGIRHALTEAFLERPQMTSTVRLATQVKSHPIKVPKMPRATGQKGEHTHAMPGATMPTMFTPLDLKVEEKRAVVERAPKGTRKTRTAPKPSKPKPLLKPQTPARPKSPPKPHHHG